MILALVTALLLLPALSHGQVIANDTTNLTHEVDSTVKAEGDSLEQVSPQFNESRFVLRRVDLDHIVEFNAKDSIILYGRNHAVMYGGSKILYGDIDMSASQITMDMDSSQVQAIGVTDRLKLKTAVAPQAFAPLSDQLGVVQMDGDTCTVQIPAHCSYVI